MKGKMITRKIVPQCIEEKPVVGPFWILPCHSGYSVVCDGQRVRWYRNLAHAERQAAEENARKRG